MRTSHRNIVKHPDIPANAQRAIPRDLLTGAPLLPPGDAQTMGGGWYPPVMPARNTEERGGLPRCHLPNYVTRVLPATRTPDMTTDEDADAEASNR